MSLGLTDLNAHVVVWLVWMQLFHIFTQVETEVLLGLESDAMV